MPFTSARELCLRLRFILEALPCRPEAIKAATAASELAVFDHWHAARFLQHNPRILDMCCSNPSPILSAS